MKNKILKVLGIFVGIVILIVLYWFLVPLVDYIIYDLAGMGRSSHLAVSLHFFIYDTIKILILLFLISSLMGVVNSYFPVERLRVFLTTKKLYGLQYLFAALFGAITPFCSCSSIPLFIGFIKGKIPFGVTLSFLITSPLVNEVAVAMFLGMFGLKATLIYAGSGILLGTIGGLVLGKMNLESELTDWAKKISNASDNKLEWESEKISFFDRLPEIILSGWSVVKGVILYVVIGIAVGALMHGYIPEGFFAKYLSEDRWYAIPIAVVLAVPMYANAAGIVPVIQVFVAKGVPLGTAIAFMMAVVGLSLPEATLLKKVMTWKLIGIFFGFVSIAIIALGYLFNFLF